MNRMIDMKSKIYYRLSLLAIIVSLTSCSKASIDISKRPNDYKLDYWLTDTIGFNELNDSLFYAVKYDSIYTYLDSNYVFETKNDTKELPNYYVIYDLCVEDQKITIQAIFITDPDVSIYGLSSKSSPSIVQRTLLNMGFKYLDQYSGWYPSYSKDQYQFTFTGDSIILSTLK